MAYHALADRAMHRWFSMSTAIQTYWYVPHMLLPALLLAALARWMGFFRRGSGRLADAAAAALLAAVVILTLDAPYSCWLGLTVRCYE